MNRKKAIEILRFHGDYNKENSFLYCIKEKYIVEQQMFHEIMSCLSALSEEEFDKAQIKDIYSIVFWCRSWLDAGWLEKQISSSVKETLKIYTGIIENALYYLMRGEIEDAFWSYNEFLDGRYH